MIWFAGITAVVAVVISLLPSPIAIQWLYIGATTCGLIFVVGLAHSVLGARDGGSRAREVLSKIINVHNLAIFLAGFVLLFFAVVMDLPHADGEVFLFQKDIWKNVFKELAFALLIAFAIVVSIERRNKDEMRADYEKRLKEVQTNVITSVFGINAERKVVDRVFRGILGDPFYRKNQHVSIEFTDITVPNDEDLPVSLLAMDVSLNYEIENRGMGKIDYPIMLEVERSPIRGVRYSEEHIRRHSKIGGVMVGSDPVSLNVVEENGVARYTGVAALEGGQTRHVSLSFSTICRHDDSEYMWVKCPCEGLTIEMKFPNGNYLIDAYAPKGGLIRTHASPSRRTWRLEGPILPNEGISISWQRSPSSSRPPEDS